MNRKVFIIISALFLASNVFANVKKESTDTIPFITYKTQVTTVPAIISVAIPQETLNHPTWQASQDKGSASSSITAISTAEQTSSTSNIPTEEVISFIKQIRMAMCRNVGDSDVRVWLSIDASGKLLGVGASTQSGFEVTFHCKGK